MEVKFRKATIEDIEKIVELCNECFQENTSIEYAKRVFLENEHDQNQVYLIGILDGEVIAHTKITVIPTIYEKMNTYAILNHVCVKPSYRRHNIATEMLVECEKVAKAKRCVALELWSNNTRVPAHECYKNFGFIVNDAKFFSKELS